MKAFFTLGSAGIYMMITIKYWENPPGVNCDTVVENYRENLPTLAYEELQIIFNAWKEYSDPV